LNSMEVTLNDQADLGQKAERRHIFEWLVHMENSE
jgi:hypothetical protein